MRRQPKMRKILYVIQVIRCGQKTAYVEVGVGDMATTQRYAFLSAFFTLQELLAAIPRDLRPAMIKTAVELV
jgi:hypothetical protein